MPNQNSPSKKNSNIPWFVIIIAFLLFAPAGVLLLVIRLLNNEKVDNSGRHPYYEQYTRQDPQNHVGARTTSGAPKDMNDVYRQAAVFVQQQNTKLKSIDGSGKRLVIVGGIIAVLFGLCALTDIGDMVYWIAEGDLSYAAMDISDILMWLCFVAGGGGCLWVGLRRRKQVKRFRRYLAVIGRETSVPLSDLASATGYPIDQVRNDLEDMFNRGLFPQGFLDHASDRLILTADGLLHRPKAPEKKPQDVSQENAILSDIRAINDAIEDEKLSAQIDRIGEITARILDYQKTHPEKAAQLHSFLSYYLPTTLKILRAYAQLEAQGVSGENITSSMERIEGMMDKVVEGFEKQLDILFQGDAMDITTDVEVLERMMAKDGLSEDGRFTMKL